VGLNKKKPVFPDEMSALVSLFVTNRDFYTSTEFKEATLRTEFLNPLLEILGWDVGNRKAQSPLEREVKEELSMKVDGVSRAPDYGFLIGAQRKWFLEAKKPNVKLESGSSAADAAFQLKRYSWSAGLSLGVLTNFHEFSIYDTRQMPEKDQSASVGRIAYFKVDELANHWEFLWGLASREAVANGSIEEYARDSSKAKGTRSVDSEFLSEIKAWRLELAKDIAKENLFLDAQQLSLAVQRLIDRLVFLRFAEARGLEHYGDLLQLASRQGIYKRLWSLFNRADDKYNSGLFHKSEIAADGEISAAEPLLNVGDEVLRQILSKLYFPYPYEFSVIPGDVLGNVYEQFLGDEIQLSAEREVVVEEKLEVRKAGGVYYTPRAVVEFIISETVMPLLEGKTPAAVAKLRFLDPSSGSGTFLISLFHTLISWHEHYYLEKPSLARKFLEQGTDGSPRLKTSERKKILLNNVFGIDLDPQAVEVTKLSLLLTVLENQAQLEFALGQILPNLSQNIVCGNTLIDDAFESLEELVTFRPLFEESLFPEVLAHGGFDAIVGNPPYLNVDTVWGAKDPRLKHLKARYSHIHTDKTDLLFYFLARAVELCKGEIGLIVSRSFLEADKAQKLRGWLASEVRVRKIVDMRHSLLFPKVGINTAMVFLTKSNSPKSAKFLRHRAKELPIAYTKAYFEKSEEFDSLLVSQQDLGSANWNFGSKDITSVLEKIDDAGRPLGEIFYVGKGMETGANRAFTFTHGDQGVLKELAEMGFLKERARNSDIKPYTIGRSNIWVIFPYLANGFDELPGSIRSHLLTFRPELEERAAFRRGDCEWWKYSFPLHLEHFRDKKLVSPYMARGNSFALDFSASYFLSTDTTVLYGSLERSEFDYLLGVMNSQLMSARFRFHSKLKGGGQYEYFAKQISRLAVPEFDSSLEFHQAVVSNVAEILKLEGEAASSLLNSEKEEAARAIKGLKAEIDEGLREFIGLSSVEASTLIGSLD